WACSEFVATLCCRDPNLIIELLENGSLFARAEGDSIARALNASVPRSDEAQLMAALRRFRHQQLLRIAWRDIAGWADLDETLRDLSDLADACIQLAYSHTYEVLTRRYGVPRGERSGEPQPLMILAMGKLGGRELNFS